MMAVGESGGVSYAKVRVTSNRMDWERIGKLLLVVMLICCIFALGKWYIFGGGRSSAHHAPDVTFQPVQWDSLFDSLDKRRGESSFWESTIGGEDIENLSNSSFGAFVQRHPIAFIMYYTPWCGYSKEARKGFGEAAYKLQANISFGAVNCNTTENNLSICHGGEHPLDGVPTFDLYKNSTWRDRFTPNDFNSSSFINYLVTQIESTVM